MDEEKLIERKLGKQNHFKVPKGYFNDFEQRLLKSIPVSVPTRKPMLRRLRPWLLASGAAAAISGFAFFITKPFAEDATKQNIATSVVTPSLDNTDYMIEKMSDYAMLDNGDLYFYVADD